MTEEAQVFSIVRSCVSLGKYKSTRANLGGFSRVRQPAKDAARWGKKNCGRGVWPRYTPLCGLLLDLEKNRLCGTYKSHVVRNSESSLTPAATAETAPRTFETEPRFSRGKHTRSSDATRARRRFEVIYQRGCESGPRVREGEWERKRAWERERRRRREREREREYFLAESSGRARTSTDVREKKTTRHLLSSFMHTRACMCVCIYIYMDMACIYASIMYARMTGKKGRKIKTSWSTVHALNWILHTQKCVFFFFLTPLIFLPRCGARSSLSLSAATECHSSWRDRSSKRHARHARHARKGARYR